MKSERGQSLVLVALAFVAAALLIMAVTGNLPGMKKGADAIGESIANYFEDDGSYIDDNLANQAFIADPEPVVYWKGSQNLFPNRHAVQSHGADAWAAVDCYNRNGAFKVMSNRNGEFNLLCQDNDGKVRDVIVKRRGTSNIFDFINAYTPKDGVLSRIEYWLRNTWNCGTGSMPNDAVIVIDGVTP